MDIYPPLLPSEQSSRPLTVAVTGAAGYVGSHVVKRLLAAGHTVHATVRDPSNSRVVGHLTELPGASQRLQLYKADLTQEGAFDAAFRGCDVVVHTASPYALDVPAGKEEESMIQPAVFGTTNVLDSVNRTPSVKKVVLTASVVCVWTDPYERGKGHVFTEDDWNTSAHPKQTPYFYAKTAAEKKAYEMQAAAGGKWQLCSMNPGTIWGPSLGNRADGESISQMRDLLSGALWPWAPPLGASVVDVRDVALAHCVAAVSPAATGRYLLSSTGNFPLPSATKILRKIYRQRWIPPLKPPKAPLLLLGPFMGLPRPITHATFRKVPQVSTAKAARDLGLKQFIPFEQSVKDMAADMVKRGLVPGWEMPRVVPFVLAGLGVLLLLVWLLQLVL